MGERVEGEEGEGVGGCYYQRRLSFVIEYSNIYLITCQFNPIESIQTNLHNISVKYGFFLSRAPQEQEDEITYSQTFSNCRGCSAWPLEFKTRRLEEPHPVCLMIII